MRSIRWTAVIADQSVAPTLMKMNPTITATITQSAQTGRPRRSSVITGRHQPSQDRVAAMKTAPRMRGRTTLAKMTSPPTRLV